MTNGSTVYCLLGIFACLVNRWGHGYRETALQVACILLFKTYNNYSLSKVSIHMNIFRFIDFHIPAHMQWTRVNPNSLISNCWTLNLCYSSINSKRIKKTFAILKSVQFKKIFGLLDAEITEILNAHLTACILRKCMCTEGKLSVEETRREVHKLVIHKENHIVQRQRQKRNKETYTQHSTRGWHFQFQNMKSVI